MDTPLTKNDSKVLKIGIGSEYVTESAPYRIKDSACRGMIFESVIIGEGITIIGAEAFKDCTHLVSVNLPDGITEIGPGAFEGDYLLSTINIPKSVSKIGKRAFCNCINLLAIDIPSDTGLISIQRTRDKDTGGIWCFLILCLIAGITGFVYVKGSIFLRLLGFLGGFILLPLGFFFTEYLIFSNDTGKMEIRNEVRDFLEELEGKIKRKHK